jgi:adenylate cyclase
MSNKEQTSKEDYRDELNATRIELERIINLTQSLHMTLSIEKIMGLTLDIFSPISTPLNQFRLFLLSESKTMLHSELILNIEKNSVAVISPKNQATPFNPKKSAACKAITQRAPIDIHGSNFSTEEALSCPKEPGEALFLPLVVGEKKIGCLALVRFTKEDQNRPWPFEQYISLLAPIAIAIHNAHQHEELLALKDSSAKSRKITRLTQSLEKFIPVPFLDRIAHQGVDQIQLGATHRESLSILFTDIRGYSTISESMWPEELLGFLNQFYACMGEAIRSKDGFIDKYIGDAIMALFAEENDGNGAQNAVLAACQMLDNLEKFNENWCKDGKEPISIGIGIHTGELIMAMVGTPQRMDSTVLGDNVNLSSRLEALNKLYGTKILISSDTLSSMKSRRSIKYREIDWLKVRGKNHPVTIYEVFSNDPLPVQKAKRVAGKYIKNGLLHRQMQDWEKAIVAFAMAMEAYPDDHVAEYHLRRCQDFRASPPEKGWDGAVRM